MKYLMTLILGLSLPVLSMAQSSTVNPGTSPSNSTTTTGDVASDQTTTDASGKKTIKEHIVEKSHNVKRAVKKGAHQIREMACRKDDQKCIALREKHRAQEQAEYHRDKLSESQDSIQSDADMTP